MARESVSRRRVLGGIATGAIGTTALGNASGESTAKYIVRTTSTAAAEAAKSRATAVRHELDFGDGGTAVAGEFPAEALNGLRERPDVEYVERDGHVERDERVQRASQSRPWGIDRVDADAAHADGNRGSGAHIAILDSGIDSDHPDLRSNLGTGRAIVEASGYAEPWDDTDGHGTHCAGIAAASDNSRGVVGVAPEATLHAVRVMSDGYASWSDLAAGLEWVADQGYDVASMSIGGTSGSRILSDACRYALNNGVLPIAAAGNNGPCSGCVMYPAAYDATVAVSSTNEDDSLSSFSATGPSIDIAAPGSGINSTVTSGYTRYSGTSMATPHVAGAAALLMAQGYTATEARQRLLDTAEDVGLSSNESGAGLLDVEAAVRGSNDDDGGGGDPNVAVSTGSATNVGETGATLNGNLTDLGGASTATVSFEYREVGASDWTTTGARTRSTTGSFGTDVSGLAAGTDYEFRAVADAGDGDTDVGNAVTFTTGTDSGVTVSTGRATDVGETAATLNGELTDLGGASSADVAFEYREAGASSWSTTRDQSLWSTGSFSAEVSGLNSESDYEFRAVADAGDGDTAAGNAVTFTTGDSTTPVGPEDCEFRFFADCTKLGVTLTGYDGSLDYAVRIKTAGGITRTVSKTAPAGVERQIWAADPIEWAEVSVDDQVLFREESSCSGEEDVPEDCEFRFEYNYRSVLVELGGYAGRIDYTIRAKLVDGSTETVTKHNVPAGQWKRFNPGGTIAWAEVVVDGQALFRSESPYNGGDTGPGSGEFRFEYDCRSVLVELDGYPGRIDYTIRVGLVGGETKTVRKWRVPAGQWRRFNPGGTIAWAEVVVDDRVAFRSESPCSRS